MTTQIEAMKRWVEVFDGNWHDEPVDSEWADRAHQALAEMRQAIAEAQQPSQPLTDIYRSFEQWKNGNVLEHGMPRTEYYSEAQLDLVEMGWKYGYDAGLAEQPAQQEPVAWMQEMPTQEDEARSVRLTTLKEHATLEWDTPIPLYAASQPPAQPLTDEMVTAAARALNKRQAEACGVDKNDHWTFYGDDIKEDARAVLEAAHGVTKGNT